MVENILGKGENAGFERLFSKVWQLRLLKVMIIW